ncbi:hypothetical protein [Mucilaginibacter myungsuensis]|uniref:SIR2-like protein n=1 Tax=Mucilaginibacter myungsuensis TaxID=649104 RepID=A0A929KWZ8_9SPHI|nr:hypothetical protein [Mucilaginibacter myungsuensis]MBE9662727.1 hypothetical protein [Mucilaginibacter myungsuensis]MDN3598147.1 hypothetical protein [Mucilaginibacter myungsuensis]
MKSISTLTFQHTLKDIHKNTDNRKFCFVLGAGASRKSGIPTGGELSKRWFSEIKERIDTTEFSSWLKDQKINKSDLAASYGSIYRKRFENDKTSGYEFLVQEMKTAKPSFGHIILAQILSRTSGHCVLTTNFDSLVESSVYQFTNKTPLVCGHESLSGYARPSKTHPLIVKIHRDLLLAPKSDPDEISELDPGWKEPLDLIFSTHIPIVIGYGGNDGSLMSYFEKMNKPSNFFWCGLDESNLSERIKKLIDKHDGRFVKVDGFDELMHKLLLVFDEIKPIKEELQDITNERIVIANKQFEEINSIIGTDKVSTKTENRLLETTRELSTLEYDSLAQKESNLEKKKEIYLTALAKYPTTSWLWGKFIHFLEVEKRETDNLDFYYQQALQHNTDEADLFENYAVYLDNIKNDDVKAEEFYLKAIALDEKNANYLGNYATFLKHNKNNAVESERYFLKSFQFDPYDPNNNGNYAQLLLERGDLEKAQTYVNTAIKFATENAVLVEQWFYRYAHYFENYLTQAEAQLEDLLSKGIRSLGWNFDGNIKQAKAQNHPNEEKLIDFARRIISK